MRLIDINTMELVEFVHPPRYAILSHRWTDHEIKYEDYVDVSKRQGPGFSKIKSFCKFLQDGGNYDEYRANQILGIESSYTPSSVQYAWVDSCCIDKRSSSELSEAINSMWDWYWNALFCVAYLADVPDGGSCNATVSQSEWFRRGWTLQELLAPRQIFFCNNSWRTIGSKLYSEGLRQAVSTASSVPLRYFDDRKAVFKASVARRMSWASRRVTTKKEDTAYCLFGLFRVNLPLLYGEGQYAFARLQEAIIQQTDDESVLAWRAPQQTNMVWNPIKDGSILAAHPVNFIDSGDMHRIPLLQRAPYQITNKGLEITAPLLQVQEDIFLLRLNCAEINGISTMTQLLHGLDREQSSEKSTSKVVRGCMIPLRRRADGTFVRSHINVWTDNPAASYHSFQTKQIKESTVYIRASPRQVAGEDVDKDPEFLGELIAVTDSDCLWTRNFLGNWFDRFQQQTTLPGLHEL